jgi:hypothetical protein
MVGLINEYERGLKPQVSAVAAQFWNPIGSRRARRLPRQRPQEPDHPADPRQRIPTSAARAWTSRLRRHRALLPGVESNESRPVVSTQIGRVVTPDNLTLREAAGLTTGTLVWVGAGPLAHPSAPNAGLEQEPDPSWARQAIKGLGLSGRNPKVFLLFLRCCPSSPSPAGVAARRADLTWLISGS